MHLFALLIGESPLRRPVLRQPGANFAAKGVCLDTQVPLGERGRLFTQILRSQLLTNGAAATVPQHVEVDPLEMTRGFVIFRVPDRPKGVMGFKGDLTQLGVGIGKRGRGKGSPFSLLAVEVSSGAVKNALRTRKRDEVGCQLMLHRLEATNGLAELFAKLCVFYRELKRPVCCSPRTSRITEPGNSQHIANLVGEQRHGEAGSVPE